jgi:hypothetical protein
MSYILSKSTIFDEKIKNILRGLNPVDLDPSVYFDAFAKNLTFIKKSLITATLAL